MLQQLKRLFEKEESFSFDRQAHDWAMQNVLTPDIWRLEQYAAQLIFVTDDLKKGGINHKHIEEAEAGPRHLQCYTHEKFTFWRKDLGKQSYGVVLPEAFKPDVFCRGSHGDEMRNGISPSRIRGELYLIQPRQFILLDRLKQNTVQFERRRVKITLPYRAVQFQRHVVRDGELKDKCPLPRISDDYIQTITAWMYFGVIDYWHDQIGGVFSHPVEIYEHDQPRVWIDQFYKWSD